MLCFYFAFVLLLLSVIALLYEDFGKYLWSLPCISFLDLGNCINHGIVPSRFLPIGSVISSNLVSLVYYCCACGISKGVDNFIVHNRHDSVIFLIIMLTSWCKCNFLYSQQISNSFLIMKIIYKSVFVLALVFSATSCEFGYFRKRSI